jgi:hypothetical protein
MDLHQAIIEALHDGGFSEESSTALAELLVTHYPDHARKLLGLPVPEQPEVIWTEPTQEEEA